MGTGLSGRRRGMEGRTVSEMITDEKAQELVTRANAIVAAGFGRTHPFPEHLALNSPIVAAVFNLLAKEPPMLVVDEQGRVSTVE